MSRTVAVGWASIALTLLGFAIPLLGNRESRRSEAASDRVLVVRAVDEDASPAPGTSRGTSPVVRSAVDGAASGQQFREAMLRRFPILQDAGYSCDGGRCSVFAVPRGHRTVEEEQALDAFYQAGFARFAAAQGHVFDGTLQTDETGDDQIVIRASVHDDR